MKKIILLAFVLPLALACSSDDSKKGSQIEVSNIASLGTWKITYFFDTDTDETSNFTGYNFTFNISDVLTASKAAETHTGTWSVSDSNSNDDSIDDLHFNIEFSSPDDFEELSDDWNIIEYSSTKIKLIDVSGGNGGIDYLTFEKN